jgi:putative hydrolase of the HAD superfamily
VLFDLDGTLTDRDKSVREFLGRFRQEFKSCLGVIEDEDLFASLQRADGNGYRARGDMCLDLVACLPWLSRPPASHIERFWWSEFPRCAVASEGLDELLGLLTNAEIRLGIVSNGGTNVQWRRLRLWGSGHT